MEETEGQEISEIRRVHGMLEDAESREIFLERLAYLVTGDAGHISIIVEKYLPELSAARKGTMEDLVRDLPKERPVVLYGAGGDAEQCLSRLQSLERFAGLCDRDPEKQRNGFHGCPVMPPEELLREHRDAAVVVGTTNFADEVEAFLRENGIPSGQIFRIAPYVHRELPESYFGMDFLRFGDREVFVDAGCYDLRSTCLLMERCAQVEKVFAFEPDPSNFLRCKRVREEKGLEQICLYPCGTWSEEVTMSFDSAASPGSHIAASGGTDVRMVPIDRIVGEERVTFIKMDVEGAELESLKGARRAIQRCHPQLAICVYHKPQDLLDIPRYVKSLAPDYRLYLRHLGTAPWETVLYAV